MLHLAHQLIGRLCLCPLWHIALCFVATACALGLYVFPWATVVVGVALIVIVKYHTISFDFSRKVCWYISVLCLIILSPITNYLFFSLLLGLWLFYLGNSSSQEKRWIVNTFSKGILLFLAAELLVFSHGTVSLFFNDISHWYSNLIRESLGGKGEIVGAYRLHVPFIFYTLILILTLPVNLLKKIILSILQLCTAIIGIFLGYFLTLWLFWGVVSLAACVIIAIFWYREITSPSNQFSIISNGHTGKVFTRIVSFIFLILLMTYGVTQVIVDGFRTNNTKQKILFINDKSPDDVEGGENDMTYFIRAENNRSFDDFEKAGRKPRYDKLAYQLLPGLGYEVDVKDMASINPEDFSRYKLVVLICLQSKMPHEHKNALYESVKKGISNVMILGDHTDIMGVEEPFNDIMAPLGIELNYDSAIPFGQWGSQIKHHRHPINGGRALAPIGKGNEPGVSVGASLKLDKNVAYPVIEAVDGFLDQGTPDAPQFAGLGDMMYTSNEIRGGFVLIAERCFGKGTFLAIGDTALFQNTSLAQNFDYVASIFSYLTHTPYLLNSPLFFWLLLVGGLIVVCDLILNYSNFLSVGAILVMVFISCASSDLRSQSDIIRSLECGVIIIDNKHGENFKHHDSERGITGLLELLYEKKDEITLISNSLSLLPSQNIKGIVFLAPRGTSINRHKERIKSFVNNGGWILFASGYYEMVGHEDLLDAFGVRILPVPLGSTQQITVTDQRFPYTPTFAETWEISTSTQDWTTEASGFDLPIVVTNSFGHGKIVVISDSFYFLNGHLGDGSMVSISERNFEFLSSLLDATNTHPKHKEEKND